MKDEITEEQAGLRAGRGTRNQVLNLNMVIENNREHEKTYSSVLITALITTRGL